MRKTIKSEEEFLFSFVISSDATIAVSNKIVMWDLLSTVLVLTNILPTNISW